MVAQAVTNQVKEKLILLKHIQNIDSKIDEIHVLKGELPLEIDDLSDEIEGLRTRSEKYANEIEDIKRIISDNEVKKKEIQDIVEKYKKQIDNVRNNREYDALSKEIEFLNLEIQLCDKKIKDFSNDIKNQKNILKDVKQEYNDKKDILSQKKKELDQIIEENRKAEEELKAQKEIIEKQIEERLIFAYNRIRRNAKNGLSVVGVERNACGGCFNRITPQRLLDIQQHSKIIVCEFCGRVLVSNLYEEEKQDKLVEEKVIVRKKRQARKTKDEN